MIYKDESDCVCFLKISPIWCSGGRVNPSFALVGVVAAIYCSVVTGSGKIYLAAGVCLILLNSWIIHEIYVIKNHGICDEGCFVESLSALAYLGAAVLTIFQSFHWRGLERKLTWLFSLTCLLCFLREVDVEDYDLPGFVIALGSGAGRNILFVVFYLALIFSVFGSAKVRKGFKLGKILRSPVTITGMIGGFFLILGSVFESFDFTAAEEVLEMNGALFVFLAAVLHQKISLSQPVS